MSARPYTPEELDRLHAAGLSAVGHYNTPRTESDGEIVLGVLAGNDRYLKPAYCAGIRAEAARMEAERSALKALGSETPTPLADELVRLRADLAAANASLATLRSRLNLADGDNLDDALSDLIGHSEWLRGVEAECARILGVEADGDIREAAARCAKERDAANERADKAERERKEARESLRRVNRRCQAAESRVATFDFLLAHRGVPMPVDSYQQASAAVAELMALYGAREQVTALTALVKEAGEALAPFARFVEAAGVESIGNRETFGIASIHATDGTFEQVCVFGSDYLRAAEVAARCAKVGEGK